VTLLELLAGVTFGGAVGAAYGSAKAVQAGLGGRGLAIAIGAAIGIRGATAMLRTVYRTAARAERSKTLDGAWESGAIILGMLLWIAVVSVISAVVAEAVVR